VHNSFVDYLPNIVSVNCTEFSQWHSQLQYKVTNWFCFHGAQWQKVNNEVVFLSYALDTIHVLCENTIFTKRKIVKKLTFLFG